MTVAQLVRPPSPARADSSSDLLDDLSDDLFASLQRSDQRRWAKTYLHGLVTVPGRKTIRRIGDQVTGREADQCLQQFVNQSPWAWEPVRQALAGRVTAAHAPEAWVLDDAVLPKNGTQSVGVDRQYVPDQGRLVNCQMGATLSLASRSGAVPVNWRLLLPRSWDDDRVRRRRTGVPAEETHRPRWNHLLDMIDEMVHQWGMRPQPVLADVSRVRRPEHVLRSLEERRLQYLVRLPPETTMRIAGRPVRLAELTDPANGRQPSLQETREPGREQATYAAAPLQEQPRRFGEAGPHPRRQVITRLRADHGREAESVFLTNVPYRRLSQLVDLFALGANAVQSHRRLHDESGLGHFEGRSFRGWHHHVTLASAAHAHRIELEDLAAEDALIS